MQENYDIVIYPLISKFRESVHNNTEYNVETNRCYDDVKGDIVNEA